MQQTGDPNPLTGDVTPRPLMTILLDHYPALLSLDELVSEYAGLASDRRKAEMMVADGLAALVGSGLAHKLGDFVFASRSAVGYQQLRL